MTETEVIRRRVVVTGRVQNVYYRASCRRVAGELGVAGWATNRPDRSVEMAFEGPADAVTAMVEWAGHGPPDAIVDTVEVLDEAPRGETGFAIR